MYDAVLISPHYDYDRAGRPIPAAGDGAGQDLSMTVPLGLLHLAQHLHDGGLKVRVVHLPHALYALQRMGLDVNQLPNPIEAILQHYPARVCGIQAHFYLYCGGALQVADIYKTLFPDAVILLGGYMATACREAFLSASESIDGIVLGEGEHPLRRVVENAVSRPGARALEAVPGIACRSAAGHMAVTPPGEDAGLDMAAVPVINPDAPPFKGLVWPSRSFINIARGRCPEACAYCVANNRAINPRPYRTMSIAGIIEQLQIYQQFGIQGVFLGESHFLDIPFMQDLIEQIIAADLDLYFELETHPAFFADKRLLARMVEAGFYRFTMGAESGSPGLLSRMGRRLTCAQLLESVERIAAAGGIAVTSWICNLPGESEADFRQTEALLEAVVRAGGFVYWIENLHVLPGSALHRNPARWDIDLVLETSADWIRWGPVSKTYVEPREALENPLRYLTHLNRGTAPRDMMNRFFSLRRQARDLVPSMQTTLAELSGQLPSKLRRSEQTRLEWYAARGWKLLLF